MKSLFNIKAIVRKCFFISLLVLTSLPDHAFADSNSISNNSIQLPQSLVFNKNNDICIGSLNAIVSGANLYVTVGDFGIIRTSEDGLNWTIRESDVDDNLNAITWNGKKFVTVGDRGSILVSVDGINWDKPTATSGHVIKKIDGVVQDILYSLGTNFNSIT